MKNWWMLMSAAALAQPVMAQKAPVSDDTPEEIAEDAARDLKDNRFYNKPGATRAEYDADWQSCRLIARGSRNPSGTVSVYNPAMYNPAISPLAGAVGGGIGSLIGAAIAEGQMRRDNRRNCLLIKGWRLVELPSAKAATIAAMPPAEREAYLNTVVGAEKVDGGITARTSFTQIKSNKLSVNGPPVAAPSLFVGKKIDPKAPFVLAEGEGAIVMAFRRNDAGSMGRTGRVTLRRYEGDKGDIAYQPRDWKKKGDKTVYDANFVSGDKKAAYELQIIRVTPGEYVLINDSVGTALSTETNCFGAPVLKVEAGQFAYFTDASPFMNAPLHFDEKHTGMIYARNFAEAKAAMATLQPGVADKMVEAPMFNRATFSCAGQVMTRFDMDGLPDYVMTAKTEAAPAPAVGTEVAAPPASTTQ